ncbi:SH3 domain-containing protein [Elizabethkingia anophelis]|uniref:Peptide-binding protein n=2 Tax=Elizabethkingia anophelis TaxID=1117645 RepID=A0A494J6F9_9FLAO|nr:peptide-binding protein [Elizabethkingia anophelis]ELB0067805.1 SH3 domain-containing protein [Elizabethkingia anophelis]ELB1892500.1 SH3 domain-containing protein [Elizabethkingia anophelis]MCT3628536.1 SH3 domain-containing protein [Elizabethkingia anophelis]MCT3632526.1 SH3 domain-containing protein [Elizabethkingia anophelis]
MIMKRKIFYFLALNISSLYFAQQTAAVEVAVKARDAASNAAAIAVPVEEAYENYIFHKEVGSTAKIFVDNTNIRDLPGLTGNVVDALPQGTSVKIIQETNIINKIQERSAQWYKIQYNGKEGYVWGANLSVANKLVDGKEFLFGVSGTQKVIDIEGISSNALKGEVSVLENGKLLGSGVFNAGTMENIAGVEFKVDKTKRFKNVDYIIQVSVSGEACGIPTYEQTYFMKKEGFLVALPLLQSVSDAGEYYHIEKYDFHMKVMNQFFMTTEEAENANSDNNEYKMDGFTKTSFYEWDGDRVMEMSSSVKKFKGKKLQ